MASPQFFKTITGAQIPLPVFFPDATRAVLKTLDSTDIAATKTPGILINTFHLNNTPGKDVLKLHRGVRGFMNWSGGAISDSGGFQVMSLAKSGGSNSAVTDEGVRFKVPGIKKKILFTPKTSIEFQMVIGADMVVVLDDFTEPNASYTRARDTVERTIKWAKECRKIFDKLCDQKKLPPEKRPYLLGCVQGDKHLDLRRECTQRLVEIGFDGLGYGGWPIKEDGDFDYEVANTIKKHSPESYLLYGLGIGKPHEIARLVETGWHIFDCVLPTRDARHKRLYIFNDDKIDNIDVSRNDFYSYYVPDKETHYRNTKPVSSVCDCHLCTNYTRSYLYHLFKIGDMTAGRLATIHNLRFYSMLMELLHRSYSK